MTRSILILRDGELPIDSPMLLEFPYRSRTRSLLILRRPERIYAWLNECPHWSTPLTLSAAQAFSRDDELRCMTHDARFRLEDGICTRGPCAGDNLEPAPICEALGHVFIFAPYSLRSRAPMRNGIPV